MNTAGRNARPRKVTQNAARCRDVRLVIRFGLRARRSTSTSKMSLSTCPKHATEAMEKSAARNALRDSATSSGACANKAAQPIPSKGGIFECHQSFARIADTNHVIVFILREPFRAVPAVCVTFPPRSRGRRWTQKGPGLRIVDYTLPRVSTVFCGKTVPIDPFFPIEWVLMASTPSRSGAVERRWRIRPNGRLSRWFFTCGRKRGDCRSAATIRTTGRPGGARNHAIRPNRVSAIS